MAWVGDGNNMANTWLQAAELLGFTVHVSTPSGYEVDQTVAGLRSNDSYKVFKDPMQACQGADLVTTDVWTSMGYEAENEERKKAFADWCVDAEMMRVAKPGRAVHALPAGPSRRGGAGRSDRRPAIGRVGRSRKQHACAEGTDGVPSAGQGWLSQDGLAALIRMPLRGGNLPSFTKRDSTANGVRPSACASCFRSAPAGECRVQHGVFVGGPGLARIGRDSRR